jgi:hypothetical protein
MRVRTGRDPLTDRYRQVSRTFRGLKKDAQVALNELAVEADQGKLANTNATFSQLAEQWLDLAKPSLGPQTLRSYRGLLDNHILPALGTRPLRQIQTADLDSLYHGLVKRKGLSTSSVRRVHTVIHCAFQQGAMEVGARDSDQSGESSEVVTTRSDAAGCGVSAAVVGGSRKVRSRLWTLASFGGH